MKKRSYTGFVKGPPIVIASEEDYATESARIFEGPEAPEAPEPSFLESLKQRISGKGEYWWIVAIYNNKVYLLGPHNTEDKAIEVATQELSDIDFDIVALPTKDKNKATQYVRAALLHKTRNFDLVTNRMSHKPPKRVKQ